MNIFKTLAIGAAVLAAVSGAQAVTISTYDMTNAQPSGTGGWSFTYMGGTIVGNNYTGGSGTLNDGIIPTDANNNELFFLADAPTITLHLAAASTISAIRLDGGNYPGNSIPGTLTGWTVTIGANTAAFTSVNTGSSVCTSGFLCDNIVSLTGSGLDLLSTNTITLSQFTGTGGGGGWFNIGEVELNGASAPAVPEPETYALMLAGLAAMGGVVRRRQTAR